MAQQTEKVMADIIQIDGNEPKRVKAKTDIKLRDKLSIKQLAFCRALISGTAKDQSDAYRIAYNAENMSDKAIGVESSRLMIHPKVSLYLKNEYARLDERACLTGLSVRNKLQEALISWSGIVDPTNPNVMGGEQQRIAAAIALGKLGSIRAFVEVSETTNVDVTPEDLQAELEQALKQAIGKV